MGPGTDRITRPTVVVLTLALAGVYLFSAVTMPAGHAGAAVAEAAIGAVQLVWLAAVMATARRWPFSVGIALQAGLSAVWVLSRTVGLPGVGRLPVGEFDLLCAVDAVMIACLCLRLSGSGLWRALAAPGRLRLGLCQLAVILAASTAYMSMASVMSMTAAAAPVADGGAGGAGGGGRVAHAAPQFFCHLL